MTQNDIGVALILIEWALVIVAAFWQWREGRR